jgi:predicted phage baseplate assembly protein
MGDGVHGARLPTGSNNVEASFRIGIGLAGQVDRKQISLLMSRPLGLEGVVNPLPASGAQDPESLDEARANAPLTVLTLDRIVSVRDFEDFARAFAGIGKAQATVLWNGERQLVHLTVGGADGTPIEPGDAIRDTLIAAVDRARHPNQEVRVESYIEQTFGLTIRIGVTPGYRPEDVQAAVYDALLETFSFSRRGFAQGVTGSEILAEVHRLPGVAAAVLADLNGQNPVLNPNIPAARAHWDGDHIVPAVLLRVDPDALIVEELAV